MVQFLRMNSLIKEEKDYNELYHLSNCCCRQKDDGWKYLVGDRITPSNIHGIELCDILAIKDKEIYYLHVKHGFDASSARDLCSQVRVGVKCVWGSLINLTKDSMIEKFYDGVEALHNSNSHHERLTYSELKKICLLYTSPSPRDGLLSRMPSSA